MTANPARHLRALEVLAHSGGTTPEAARLMSTGWRQVRRYLDRHGRHDLAAVIDRNDATTRLAAPHNPDDDVPGGPPMTHVRPQTLTRPHPTATATRGGNGLGDEPPCREYVRTHDVRTEGDPWFPEGRESKERVALVAIAERICAACPLAAQCNAARTQRDSGVWAGREWELEPGKRHAILRTPRWEKDPATLTPIPHGTITGHRMHRRRGEEPCQPCRDAWSEYQVERRAAKAQMVTDLMDLVA